MLCSSDINTGSRVYVPMTKLTLGRILISFVTVAIWIGLPVTAEAYSETKAFPEECAPLRQANEWVSHASSLQMTSRFQRFGDEPQLAVQELIYTSDTVYRRDHPYEPWRAESRSLIKIDARSLEPDNCRRLYEATVDGVRTIVFEYNRALKSEYGKANTEQTQWYRCNIWIEKPKYRPLKAVCEGSFEWTRRWFYRSDISVPSIKPDF